MAPLESGKDASIWNIALPEVHRGVDPLLVQVEFGAFGMNLGQERDQWE